MIIEIFGNFYKSDPVSLQKIEMACVTAVKDRISKESHYESNLVVNLTWFWYRDENFVQQFLDWIDQHTVPNSTKIYFTAFIDNVEDFRRSTCFERVKDKGHDISFEGYGEDWYTIFPNLLTRYDVSQIQLNPKFKYKYLSYNRKPWPHRKELVSSLCDNNLLDHGWVTFQSGHFSAVDNISGNTDGNLFHTRDLVEYLQYPDPNLSRPDDIKSLGNIDIWNNSYLVITTETSYDDPWHMSEKTWKPLMGMRPYVLIGHPNLLKILKSLGMYTPGELFNEPKLDKCEIPFIIEFIKGLCNRPNSHIYEMWCNQLPMLKHNRKRFEFLARRSVTPKVRIELD